MHKQPEVTEKTRRAFIDAFCTLYSEKPIEKITVNEVTQIAGYNRSTFYQYFKDIYQLLTYLESYLLDTIKATLTENMPTGSLEPFTDNTFIGAFIQVFEDNSLYFSVLLGRNGNVRYTETVRDEMKLLFTQVMGVEIDNQYAQYLFDYYSSAFFSVITCWFRNDRGLSTKELCGLIQNILRLGVVPVLAEYGLDSLPGSN